MKFQTKKVFDGFSTCFRQWKAEGTHCSFLHGYGVSFVVTFEGVLDERNWVWDFGGMKRSKTTIEGKNPDEWIKWLLDHTVIIAPDDPELFVFKEMDDAGIIQLRVLDVGGGVGAERFAEYLCEKLDAFVRRETDDRVRVVQVEFRENEKNSAIYIRN